MKIQIEIDENLTEEEIIIRCNAFNENILGIQTAISESIIRATGFLLYKEDEEYYISMNNILFFETADGIINAHTRDNVYQVKKKLYELEETLPGNFMRISKSTILNTRHVYSINRNLTASSVVSMRGTHKQLYVSRNYYKLLREKLEGKV